MSFFFKVHVWLPIFVLAAISGYFTVKSLKLDGINTGFYASPSRPPKLERTGHLHILNWEEYFAENTISEFEKRTGIHVEITTYADEDEMLSNVLSYPDRYDLVVVSGDTVAKMAQGKRLQKLNAGMFRQYENIDPVFEAAHTVDNDFYGIPYLWGTTGIVVNTEKIPTYPKSWSLLADKRYEGKIGMLKSPLEVFAAALKLHGFSINDQDYEHNVLASNWLIDQRKLVYGYLDPVTIQEKLLDDTLWISQCYSGDALVLVEEHPQLHYFLPQEGFAKWIDYLCLLHNSKNQLEAIAFIDYIMEPEVIAQISNELKYPNCNKASTPFIDPQVLHSPHIYPPEEVMAKGERFHSAATLSENELRIIALRNRCCAKIRLSE